MAVVSTGQFTLVDQNDSRSITAVLTATSANQTWSLADTTTTYLPDWSAAENTITPIVHVGGVGNVVGQSSLTGGAFKLRMPGGADVAIPATNGAYAALTTGGTLGAAFNGGATVVAGTQYKTLENGTGNCTSLIINSNMKSTVQTATLVFTATYTDPATGFTSDIRVEIPLMNVQRGSNATYIQLQGKTTIKEMNNGTTDYAYVAAYLVRAAGVDTSGLTYTFNNVSGGGAALSHVGGLYGFSTSTHPAASAGVIGSNVNGSTYNTVTISPNAVANLNVYSVTITQSATSETYTAYFTVIDTADPYTTTIKSSAGDKLKNGVGTTNLTPQVSYGGLPISDANLATWTFNWSLYHSDGVKGGFTVDRGTLTKASGAPIVSNVTPANAAASFNVVLTGNIATGLAQDTFVKIVKNNVPRIYKVSVAGSYSAGPNQTTVTLIRASTGSYSTASAGTQESGVYAYDAPTAAATPSSNFFAGAQLFAISETLSTTGVAAITVTGTDVESKAVISVESNRP